MSKQQFSKKYSLVLHTDEASFYWTPFQGLHKEVTDQSQASSNNFYITGGTKRGKTKLCKDIIASTLEEGGKVLVFDRGGEYTDLCLLLGGDYLTENDFFKLGVDLFGLIPDGQFKDDIEHHDKAFESLTTLILMMAFPHDSYDAQDENYVLKALKVVWDKKGGKGHLVDIIRTLEVQGDEEEGRTKEIASNLSSYFSRYQPFFDKNQKNDFQSNLTVVDVSAFHAPIAQTMMIGLLMRVAYYQQTPNSLKPFVVVFEDTCLWEPSFAFPSFIEAFSRNAHQLRISLGKVSKSLPNVMLQNKKAILEKVFWEGSNWKVFFAENNLIDFATFSKANKELFSRGDLTIFYSLYDLPYSFALLGEKHPLRKYKTKLEGHHHALSS